MESIEQHNNPEFTESRKLFRSVLDKAIQGEFGEPFEKFSSEVENEIVETAKLELLPSGMSMKHSLGWIEAAIGVAEDTNVAYGKERTLLSFCRAILVIHRERISEFFLSE